MSETTRRGFLKHAGASAAAFGLGGGLLANLEAAAPSLAAGEPIKIGLLNAISGSLSIPEKSMWQGSMLAVDEINKAGGINGRKLQAISEDYKSDFTVAVQKAQKLLTKDKVAIVVGGYTSASRVALIPTFQKYKQNFFYGTYYEGLECDTSTFYAGAVPNQFLLDYIPWITKTLGKKLYIVGSDYVYPKTVSAIFQKIAPRTGGKIVADRYFELGTTDFGSVIADIEKQKPDVIISNLVGASVPAFYKQYRAAGFTAAKNPIAATVTTEVEVAAMSIGDAKGHFQTATYFQSLDNSTNKKFVAAFKKKYGSKSVTHMPLVGNYNAVHLFAEAAKKAKSLSAADLRKALVGAKFTASPEGQPITIGSNHHGNHPSYVGEIGGNGQFKIVETFKPRLAIPYPTQVVAASKAPTCPTPFK